MPLASQEKYGRKFDERLTEPDPVHWRICTVLESLLFVAERHGIQVWADYGTLLGLKRDRHVILWDYDADLGMWAEDREKFFAAVKEDQQKGLVTPLLVVDNDYYNDAGCVAAYLAKNPEHTDFWKDDICDIIFNVIEGDMVKSLQSAQVLKDYPCAYNYMGKVSDVLPLRPDVMLGHRIWTWNNWELPLDLTYGNWRKPLKDVGAWIVPAFHGHAVKAIPELSTSSFEDFFAAKSKSRTPLILRQTPLLATSEQRYREALKKQKRNIFGYTSSIIWDKNEAPAEEVYDLFLARKLPYNVVDAAVDDVSFLPEQWRQVASKQLGKDGDDGVLCWVLTNAPCVSHWHTDPEYNDPEKHSGNPGGWMKLNEGRKIWWTLPKEDFAELQARGHTVESVAKLSLSELLKLEHGFAWGKVLIGEIYGGDLLWFPPGCLHKVVTLEHSWGWGGYL